MAPETQNGGSKIVVYETRLKQPTTTSDPYAAVKDSVTLYNPDMLTSDTGDDGDIVCPKFQYGGHKTGSTWNPETDWHISVIPVTIKPGVYM